MASYSLAGETDAGTRKKSPSSCSSWEARTRRPPSSHFSTICFCDPDIINFPGSFLARKPLAKLISTTRSKIVRQHYAEIGGGSPIRRLTEQQARALEVALRPHISARTIVAMRYWHPNTEEAIAALESAPLSTNSCCCRSTRTIPSPPPAAA